MEKFRERPLERTFAQSLSLAGYNFAFMVLHFDCSHNSTSFFQMPYEHASSCLQDSLCSKASPAVLYVHVISTTMLASVNMDANVLCYSTV